MKYFYFLSTVIFIIGVFLENIRYKKLISLTNIIFISVTINFFLYSLNWSSVFREEIYSETYYVIAVIQLVFAVKAFCKKKVVDIPHFKLKRVAIGTVKLPISLVLLLICICFCIMENIYTHGGLFSQSSHAHTATMPLIGPILKALYPVAYTTAFIDYQKYRNKSIVFFAIICLVYSVIGAQGRFWAVLSFLCALFVMASWRVKKNSAYDKGVSWIKSLKLRYKIIIIVLAVISISYLVSLGARRISTFTYAQIIGYNGPFEGTYFGEIFAWYYGYFPFSFYNLNTTIHRIAIDGVYTYGGFMAYPFLALINIDSLFGVNYSAMTYSTRIIQNNAATVATGYYEMFADFGYFFVISLLILYFITCYFEKRRSFNAVVSYSYMCVCWLFMSFLNIFTVGIPLYVFVISWIINKFFVIRE